MIKRLTGAFPRIFPKQAIVELDKADAALSTAIRKLPNYRLCDSDCDKCGPA